VSHFFFINGGDRVDVSFYLTKDGEGLMLVSDVEQGDHVVL
jgi:hypothetical protein